jgi:hypothetical protein
VHLLLCPSVYLFFSLPALCPLLLICLYVHLPIFILARLFICSSAHLLIKLICLSTNLFICPAAHLLVVPSAPLIIVSSSLHRILPILSVTYLSYTLYVLAYNSSSAHRLVSSALHLTTAILSFDIMYLAANLLICINTVHTVQILFLHF